MPLALVRKVLLAACDYHKLIERRSGVPAKTCLIWHGGEPLALPIEYLEGVLQLAHDVITASGIERERVTLAMQTNLYAVNDRAIALLQRYRVGVGVSFDLVRGVRRNLAGQTTEDRVLRNLDRMRTAGIAFGAITVLARHTCPDICDIFDFWATRNVGWRVLPLFAGPPGRDTARFAVGEDELVSALCRLFIHWLHARTPIVVKPLDEWLANVVRHLLGLRAEPYNRRLGESVFVVRPNGGVFQVSDLWDSANQLGSLEHQTIAELLDSGAYGASLDRSDTVSQRLCGDCRFLGGCDGYPAHASPMDQREHARCPVVYRVYEFMERYLQQARLGASELCALVSRTGLKHTAEATLV